MVPNYCAFYAWGVLINWYYNRKLKHYWNENFFGDTLLMTKMILTWKQALMSASVCCGTVNMSTHPSSIVFNVTMSMKPSSRKVRFSLQVVVYFILRPGLMSFLVFWKVLTVSLFLGHDHVMVPLHCSSFNSTRAVWNVDGSMCNTWVPQWASWKHFSCIHEFLPYVNHLFCQVMIVCNLTLREEMSIAGGIRDTRLTPW